jgi:polyhydroxyalkanoate synthesis regulator protein
MPNDFILVKRYGRSRLYDTFHARYVTVSDLQEWWRRHISFIVVDTETGADVTKVLLASAES